MALGMLCDHRVRILGSAAADNITLSQTTALVNSDGVGWYICSARGDVRAPLDKEWWQPYIVNGRVIIIGTISNIQP